MENDNKHDIDIWLEDFLTGLLEHCNLDIWVSGLDVDEKTSTYTAQLDGPDKARVIGRDGQVLDALQHLMIAAAANAGFFKDRIIVDVDGYRQRRDDQLKEDVEEAASEILDHKTPIDMEPMSARERRLIHLAISEIDGVSSQSVGFGDERFVRLAPSE